MSEQAEFSFEGPPKPEKLFAFGTQARILYEELLNGPTTNVHIIKNLHIYNHTARISEIRKALQPHLLDVAAKRIGGGVFEYSLAG